MWPSHGAFCAFLSCFFEALLLFSHNFCKIHVVAGIFVLCPLSLCLASDALLEFFVCVFFRSLEFFFKIFVILLLDLFSNFVLVSD